MPLFLRTNAPPRREKLILGGALTHRLRHRPMKRPGLLKRPLPPPAAARVKQRRVNRRRRRGPIKRLVRQQQQQRRPNIASKMLGKAASKARGVLSQLVRPRQIKRAAKSVLSQLAQSPRLEQAVKRVGRQLVTTTGLSGVGKKRPLEVVEEEERPPAPKRTATGMSRIGYRGHTIHRGAGTKQNGKSFLF